MEGEDDFVGLPQIENDAARAVRHALGGGVGRPPRARHLHGLHGHLHGHQLAMDPSSDEELQLEDTRDMEVFTDDESSMFDTTAEQVKRGVDVQGIPWETTDWSRDTYRVRRDADYASYYNREEDVLAAQESISKEITTTYNCRKTLYNFTRNWRNVRSSIVHFQLRNLLWATSAHDVYYISQNRVLHWNNLSRMPPDEVMDVSGVVATAVAPGLGQLSLCTLCAHEGLVAAGGFGGELIARRIGADEPFAASTRVTSSDNGITNAIDIYKTPSGVLSVACSNNDMAVRLLDGSIFAKTAEFRLPWAVNCCVASPKGHLLCAVGDDPEAVVIDPASGKIAMRLGGHHDFSFAVAWHPDGNVIATGNQDLTTRVFDLRRPTPPLAVLKAHIGAVRSLRFSPNGRYLAMAEPADYVTLYDAKSEYRERQDIDLFGELAGTSFSPDGERLFIAVSDVHYASLVQFNKA